MKVSDISTTQLRSIYKNLFNATEHLGGMLYANNIIQTEHKRKLLRRDMLENVYESSRQATVSLLEIVRGLGGIVNSETPLHHISKTNYDAVIISRLVDEYYGFNTSERNRSSVIVMARNIKRYILRKYTFAPLVQIGALTGNADHTTVCHSLKRVRELMEIYDNVRDEIMNVENFINNKNPQKNG